jgi:hypothetical protein
MMKDASTDVFTGKSFKIITQDGKHGILQSNLWKQLEITGRDGSRLALRLEKQSLIKREKILEKGRWTYKLLPIELPVDIVSIDKAPCLMCPVEHMCSEEGSYSPNNCNLIQDWLLSAVDSLSQQQYHTAPQQQKKTTSRTFSETSKAAGETYFQTSNKIIIKNETFPG